MNLKLIYTALIILLAGCESCEDDPQPTELEKLPPATQEGKNTFGCLVNGKAWITRTSTDATAFYQEGVFAIGATNDKNTENIFISIYDENLSEGEYHLPNDNGENTIQDVAGLNQSKTTKCRFETMSDYTGTVQITHLDQSQGSWIVSGTFEFEAYSPECDTIIKVTDGRFDLNYAP